MVSGDHRRLVSFQTFVVLICQASSEFQDTHGGNGSFLKDALDNTQDNYLGTREFLDLVMF